MQWFVLVCTFSHEDNDIVSVDWLYGPFDTEADANDYGNFRKSIEDGYNYHSALMLNMPTR